MSKSEKINRMDFLKKMGFGGASLMAVYMGACKNSTTPGPVSTFTIDMSTSAYSKLKTVGQYAVVNGVVVACVSTGVYAAVTQTCSHEGEKQVYYSSGKFICSAHGAQFTTTGVGLNSAASNGLTTYKVAVNGNILTIN